jgi:hypothetical protein
MKMLCSVLQMNKSNPSYSGGGGRRIVSSRLVQARLLRLYLKNKNKRAGRLAQVVECLPRKHRL